MFLQIPFCFDCTMQVHRIDWITSACKWYIRPIFCVLAAAKPKWYTVRSSSIRKVHFETMYIREFPINPRLIIIALISIMVIAVLFRPDNSANRLVSRWKPQPLLTEPEPQANGAGAP